MSKVVNFVIGAASIVAGIVFAQPQLIIAGASMIVSGAANLLLAPKPKARNAAELMLQLGEQPRMAMFGEGSTDGSLVDGFNYGGKYGTDWEVLIIRLADHRCHSLTGFYVDDQYVAFGGDGAVAGFNGQLELYFRGDTTNDPLPAIVTTHGPGWTPADIGEGGCDVTVAYKADDPEAKSPTWSGGRPKFRFVPKGAFCYDPRKDDNVAGGEGDHRWLFPSTWEWTDNVAVCRYNWARGLYANDEVGDPSMLLIGRGLSAEEAPPENVAAAANLCDELEGGEKRWRCDGPIYADQKHLEVEEMFALACGGTIVTREGSVEIEPAQAKAVVASFTDDDLLAGSEVEWNNGILSEADDQWINTVIPRYVEPAQKWNDHGAPVRRDTADIIADKEPREATIALRLVKRAAQAGAVGEIVRRMGRLWGRGAVTLGPRFCELEEGDWIEWTSARHFEGASKIFRIETYSNDEKWHTTLSSLREIAASVFGEIEPIADQAEATPQDPPGDTSIPDADAWTLTADTLLGAGGGSIPVLTLSGASDDDRASALRIEYWQDDGVTDPEDANWSMAGDVAPTTTQIVISSIAPGGDYYAAISNIVQGIPGERRIEGPVTADALVAGTFEGAGDLATMDDVPWTTHVSARPIELTDGRVAAGFDNVGDLARNVTTARRNSSSLLGYSGGAAYTGDLNATVGAAWGSNLTGRPTELTDGRVSAALDSSGDLARNVTSARANSSNILRYTSGGLFSGDLNATLGAAWGSTLTGRPTELTDGRITAGLDASGDLNRNLTSGRANTSNLLRYTSGALYSGDLNATVGAAWGSNVTGRPTELTDGRVAAGFDSSGDLARNVTSARANSSNILRYTSGGLFAGDLNATLGAAWGSTLTGRPTELTDGRITAGLDASGDLARNVTSARANGSNLLRYASGGLFAGDLNATVGAAWGSNLTGRPTELTDGRITAGLDASGDLARDVTSARANGSNLLRYTSGGLFAGDLNATAGAAWASNVTGRPTELTDGRVAAGFDASGDLARNLTTARANSSNILRRTGGGLDTGDLDATSGENLAPTLADGAVAWTNAFGLTVQTGGAGDPALYWRKSNLANGADVNVEFTKPIAEGQKYWIAARYRATGAGTRQAQILGLHYNAAGTYLSSFDNIGPTTLSGTGWNTIVGGPFTPPANCAKIIFRLYMVNGSGSAVTSFDLGEVRVLRNEPGADNYGRVQLLSTTSGRALTSLLLGTSAMVGIRNTNDVLMTSSDAGSTATISVPSHERKVPGASGTETRTYNSGSITGRAFGTAYYVYCDDPGFAGGAVTYVATTNSDDLAGSVNRVNVGYITTVNDGGSGGGGGGGGGGAGGGGGGGQIP